MACQALAPVLEGLLLADRAVYLAQACPEAQVPPGYRPGTARRPVRATRIY